MLRFLSALVLVAVGAAAFAIGFRSALGLVYRHVLGGRDVMEAITHAAWYVRQMKAAGQIQSDARVNQICARAFRSNVYDAVARPLR